MRLQSFIHVKSNTTLFGKFYLYFISSSTLVLIEINVGILKTAQSKYGISVKIDSMTLIIVHVICELNNRFPCYRHNILK
jgi:hypothetical protein